MSIAIENALNRLAELEKENKELKEMLKNRIKYTQELEKDLFENASHYVVPKSVIKEKIKEIQASLNDDCLALHEFQRLAKIDVLKEILE